MASPAVFGRVDNPDQLNLDPFDFTILGYRVREDGSKVEEPHKFTASGVRPFYVQIDMVRAALSESGMMSSDSIAKFVESSLLNDAERERFRETLELPDVYFDTGMLGELAEWLGETYSGRPTKPRSGSRSGRSSGGRRSTGAVGATGSKTSASSPRSRR